MSSATLDTRLRKIGYFLVERRNVDGRYWFVGSFSTHNGWNCATLAEVKSLLAALRDKAEQGGTICHDGDSWRCEAE